VWARLGEGSRVRGTEVWMAKRHYRPSVHYRYEHYDPRT
jgi:hypothetical protein